MTHTHTHTHMVVSTLSRVNLVDSKLSELTWGSLNYPPFPDGI